MDIDFTLLIIVALGGLFFATAVIALCWCFKTGQLKNFEKNARCIFNEEEPVGEQTDFFPKANKFESHKINQNT